MKVFNPYTKKEIGEIHLSDKNELESMLKNGEKAERSMCELSSHERSFVLNQIVECIKKQYDTFITTIIEESAKPFIYAKAEVDRAIQTFTIAAEEANRLPHELMSLDQTKKGEGLKGEIHYFPKGLIFGISPFNFPLNLAAHKIAPALASGCPIILKPSSKTPLTMELLASVINKTNLPEGAFQLIHCSRDLGDFIIEHAAVKVVSFTGSPNVGWEIKKKAYKKKVVLELGGNAAATVCEDANIQQSVDELVVGAFAYSGQVCIHTQRIYVHAAVYEQFIQLFCKKAEQLTLSDPRNNDCNFSVMIDESNAERVKSWIDEAIQSGAKCLIGGNQEGNFVAPTVLTNVPKDLKVRNEEVFGPVVIIESFEDLNEAISTVNDSRWGLQAAIFTDSISKREEAFRKLNVGGLIHNRSTTFRVDNMPYGGIKDSGYGREGVSYAMKDYLEPKLLVR